MKKGEYLDVLLRSPKTVFSINEIGLLWREASGEAIRNRLSYYLKHKKLIRLRRGIYAKNSKYEKLELATKIHVPSYISFETVLAKAGIIFQFYNSIFLASYLTREIECDESIYTFRKIKSEILTNPHGINEIHGYSIASAERAFLDTIYIHKDYYFDNLSSVDWGKASKMIKIYDNNRMLKTFNSLYRQHKDESE